MVYGYSRRWLSVGGATLACLSYATMGQVLELGNLGETETMYTLIVAGSILLWHWAWVSEASQTLAWCAGYSLAAAGMLAKGYQAPIYFGATAVLYLVVSRQWRALLTRSHVVGVLCFFLIWNAWNIPYLWMTGWENTVAMYHNDVAMRFDHQTWASWAQHLLRFPLEVLVCMLPWSFLLPILAMPRFWKGVGKYREPLALAIVAIAITFPSVWFTPGAHGRYYMPLYPCFAILIAIATEKVLSENGTPQSRTVGSRIQGLSAWLYNGSWRRYLRGFGLAMIAVAAYVLLSSQINPLPELTYTAWMKGCVAGTLLVVAATVFWSAANAGSVSFSTVVVAMVAGIGVVHVGIITKLTLADTNDSRPTIADVKSVIPEGKTLASVGLIDHLFALHYGDEIPVLGMIEPDKDLINNESYVCFNSGQPIKIPPGVSLHTIATINCKRSKKSNRSRQVSVVRCVWDEAHLARLRDKSTASKRY